ncbi:MAG: DNA repair protein RecO [Rhizobacter sp.]|nr:DNA repair protein RecO [Chlorobiales bacterium]
MIHKIEAVVLRAIDFRDQSKILTLYTRAFGRMTAIAKGCRTSPSKFGSSLEVGSHIEAVLYKKDTRDIQNLTDAHLLTPMLNLTTSMERLSAALQTLELVRVATEDGDRNTKLFELLLGTLKAVDAPREAKQKLFAGFFFFFEVHLIGLLGFKPSFGECVLSGKNIIAEIDRGRETNLVLLSEKGGVALASEARSRGYAGQRVSLQAYRIIEHLASAKADSVGGLSMQAGIIGEVSEILDVYLRFHIDDLPSLRTRDIFNQLAS